MKLIAYLVFGASCIGLTLIYLNSAAYNFWLSYGPPTQHPEDFLIKAIRHFIYSAVLLFLSGVSIYFYRKLKNSNKQNI